MIDCRVTTDFDSTIRRYRKDLEQAVAHRVRVLHLSREGELALAHSDTRLRPDDEVLVLDRRPDLGTLRAPTPADRQRSPCCRSGRP